MCDSCGSFKLRFDPLEIPELVRRYDPEQDGEALAAGAAIKSGERSRALLRTIFNWKTKGRGRSRLERNRDDEIADALDLACQARTERAAMAVLCGLQGVDIPVASAILMTIDPGHYTVIDFRALESLGHRDVSPTLSFFLAYLHACRSLSAAHNVNLRDFDRALWRWSWEHSPKGTKQAG